MSQYNADPLQWQECFGQLKNAIDAQSLFDNVKLTYLKTLVTGRAKTAIAEFAYCGVMYKDALKTLERKFGQPQAVVSAHLDKLSSFTPLKMHNSDNIINYSATFSSLVGVFKSLSYDSDLESASLLNTAVQQLPPNLKESWSLFTVKNHWVKPPLLDFNDWLKETAEAHDLMKQTSSKARTEDKLPQELLPLIHKLRALREQPQHRQRLQPLAALCLKVTTASESVGYIKKSLPLSEQR